MLKRIACLALFAVVLAVASCGGDKPEEKAAPKTDTPEATPAKPGAARKTIRSS